MVPGATRIEWGSLSQVDNVHDASNVSWVTDEHGNDTADADADE